MIISVAFSLSDTIILLAMLLKEIGDRATDVSFNLSNAETGQTTQILEDDSLTRTKKKIRKLMGCNRNNPIASAG